MGFLSGHTTFYTTLNKITDNKKTVIIDNIDWHDKNIIKPLQRKTIVSHFFRFNLAYPVCFTDNKYMGKKDFKIVKKIFLLE